MILVLLSVLLMIFSIQKADPFAGARPPWRNAVPAPVNWFTGGIQIRHFVMAITVTVDGGVREELTARMTLGRE